MALAETLDLQSSARLAPHPPIARYYRRAEHKRGFVGRLFDEGAGDYERVERLMALGSGSWYRRQTLLRAGLAAGMRVLDVATGTGLVAREAARIVGDGRRVVGIDPSAAMLAEGRRIPGAQGVIGRAEHLPLASSSFDFLSMGFALRHVSDLAGTFAEFLRVLRPGGTVCLLEITPPRGRIGLALLKWYIRGIIPALSRMTNRHVNPQAMWEYYWDTIESCVRPECIVQAMADAGFTNVNHHREVAIFSEYTGRKPPIV
jgi:demethylmenaquinone methyltransferase/2-methoxy-6-polyprenyl-1,4-benzoquinol methylase